MSQNFEDATFLSYTSWAQISQHTFVEGYHPLPSARVRRNRGLRKILCKNLKFRKNPPKERNLRQNHQKSTFLPKFRGWHFRKIYKPGVKSPAQFFRGVPPLPLGSVSLESVLQVIPVLRFEFAHFWKTPPERLNFLYNPPGILPEPKFRGCHFFELYKPCANFATHVCRGVSPLTLCTRSSKSEP